MAGIPLPRPIPVAPFTVPAGEQTYSQIFADTMGNAATPSDGFDQLFGALTALTDSVSSIADLDPIDVQGVSDNAAYFGTSPEGALAIALQPASDATDAALSDYATIVPPAANPTPPVPPTGNPPPTPQPTPDCTAPSGAFTQRLADMKLGAAAFQIQVALSAHQKGLIGSISGALQCGDATIFSVQTISQIVPPTGPSQAELVTTISLTVTPSKTGFFSCIVAETSTETVGNVPVTTYTYWAVQINP